MTRSVVPRSGEYAESGVLVVGRWRAPTASVQQAALDAAAAAWDLVDWPDGLERFVIMAADDQRNLLNLSWWRDADQVSEFTGHAKQRWSAHVDERAPGVRRLGVDTYRRYTGATLADGETGALVAVDIATSDAVAARAWMDAMVALPATESPAPGMLTATFHLDSTGTKILNLAEWTTSRAHEDLVTGPRSDASRGLVDPTNPTRPTGYLRAGTWRECPHRRGRGMARR